MDGEQVIELTIRLHVVVTTSVQSVDPVRVVASTDPSRPLQNCRSCGRSDSECRQVIDSTAAARSCCGTCKIIDTHPPMPQVTIKEV